MQRLNTILLLSFSLLLFQVCTEPSRNNPFDPGSETYNITPAQSDSIRQFAPDCLPGDSCIEKARQQARIQQKGDNTKYKFSFEPDYPNEISTKYILLRGEFRLKPRDTLVFLKISGEPIQWKRVDVNLVQWEKMLFLEEDTNRVTIQAKSNLNQPFAKTIEYVHKPGSKDSFKPIVLINLSDNEISESTDFLLTGMVYDDSPSTVWVEYNDNSATEATIIGTSWYYKLTLRPGQVDTVVVYGKDNSLQQSPKIKYAINCTATELSTIDNDAPILEVLWPKGGDQVVDDPIVEFSIRATDTTSGVNPPMIIAKNPSGTSHQNPTTRVINTDLYKGSVTLQNTINEIEIVVRDKSPNANETRISFVQRVEIPPDTTKPTITLISHQDGEKVSFPSVTIEAEIRDDSGINPESVVIKVNTSEVFQMTSTNQANLYEANINLNPGENTIQITAQDFISHLNQETITFVLKY